MHRPQTPQPGFGSITLFQKFIPHFKILDPRLRFNGGFFPLRFWGAYFRNFTVIKNKPILPRRNLRNLRNFARGKIRGQGPCATRAGERSARGLPLTSLIGEKFD